MDKDSHPTIRNLPVLIGYDQQNVMAKAEILQKPDSVLIEITAVGERGKLLAEFLQQIEPIALSFSWFLPVQNTNESERISDAEEPGLSPVGRQV